MYWDKVLATTLNICVVVNIRVVVNIQAAGRGASDFDCPSHYNIIASVKPITEATYSTLDKSSRMRP